MVQLYYERLSPEKALKAVLKRSSPHWGGGESREFAIPPEKPCAPKKESPESAQKPSLIIRNNSSSHLWPAVCTTKPWKCPRGLAQKNPPAPETKEAPNIAFKSRGAQKESPESAQKPSLIIPNNSTSHVFTGRVHDSKQTQQTLTDDDTQVAAKPQKSAAMSVRKYRRPPFSFSESDTNPTNIYRTDCGAGQQQQKPIPMCKT